MMIIFNVNCTGDMQCVYGLMILFSILGVKGTEVEEVKEISHDDSEKKKADDLWSAFKADVAVPIKRLVIVYYSTVK